VSLITSSGFPSFNLRIVFSAAGLVPLVNIWRTLRQGIFDPYRPELHYMRGPGPKWREKHTHVSGSWSGNRFDQQVPGLARPRTLGVTA
jgi:hypothetical protein